MRCFLSFDTHVAFGDRAQKTSREHILAVSRKRVLNEETAARTERQPVHMLPLGDNGADGVGRRARLGAGITNREIAHTQRGGEIALEQQWRGLERRRDVVEAEIAAVARQELGDVNPHAQQITHRIGILGAIEPMQHVAARIVFPGRRGIEARGERRRESCQFGIAGGRRPLRRHGAHTDLANHFFPDVRVCPGIAESRLLQCERRTGGDSRLLVVAGHTVAVQHVLVGRRRVSALRRRSCACRCRLRRAVPRRHADRCHQRQGGSGKGKHAGSERTRPTRSERTRPTRSERTRPTRSERTRPTRSEGPGLDGALAHCTSPA